jgi:hypothetical protein
MSLKSIWERYREARLRKANEPKLDDDETSDKYLRSLRRQRRIQLEELEKQILKKRINEYEKRRSSLLLYGNRPPQQRQNQPGNNSSFLGRGRV